MIYDTFLQLEYWHTVGIDIIPQEPGIYMILGMTANSWHYEVFYIGSSANLFKRLKNHEILRSFRNSYSETGTSVKVHFLPIEDHIEYEKAAIKKFGPLANIKHNQN